MPEYLALRLTLALLEFFVAISVWRGRHGWALAFCAYAYLDACSNLLPFRAYDPAWWRYCWLPFALVRLVVAFAVSAELLRLTHGFTFLRERRLMVTFGLGCGAVLVISGWSWRGENTFQQLVTARQYLLLALATATTASWTYVRIFRVVDMPSGLQRAHGGLWVAYLWTLFLLSSTGAAGLARLLIDFHAWDAWRYLNDCLLLAEAALMGCWLFRFSRVSSRLTQ